MARRLPASTDQDEEQQDHIARSRSILKETAGASSTRLFRPMTLPDG
jgi:hypothetical protein